MEDQEPTPLPVEEAPLSIEELQNRLADAEAALRNMARKEDRAHTQWRLWEQKCNGIEKEFKDYVDIVKVNFEACAIPRSPRSTGYVFDMREWIITVKTALNGTDPTKFAHEMACMKAALLEAEKERDEFRKKMNHFIGVNQQVRSERNRAMGALSLLRDYQTGRLTRDEGPPIEKEPPIPALAGED